MNTRNILILIVVVLVILVGVVGYMLMQSFNNVTPNITNNTTQVTINKNQLQIPIFWGRHSWQEREVVFRPNGGENWGGAIKRHGVG